MLDVTLFGYTYTLFGWAWRLLSLIVLLVFGQALFTRLFQAFDDLAEIRRILQKRLDEKE